MLFLGELILSLGAGMTVKFFPVFFNEEIGVSPAVFQAVAASLFGFTALGTLIANRAAKRYGRLAPCIAGFCLGICCTASLGLLGKFYGNASLMLTIYVVRCVSQWSFGALMGSVIADYTPKASRGRWKALTSVLQASWSGSAGIGGWLIDSVGFGPTFVITACFQAPAPLIWFALLPLVAKESEILAAADAASSTNNLSTALAPDDHESVLSLQNMPAGFGALQNMPAGVGASEKAPSHSPDGSTADGISSSAVVDG